MYDQKEGQGIPGTLTIRLCLVAAGIMAAANDQSGFFDGCMD